MSHNHTRELTDIAIKESKFGFPGDISVLPHRIQLHEGTIRFPNSVSDILFCPSIFGDHTPKI
jgi:hypothetical protein